MKTKVLKSISLIGLCLALSYGVKAGDPVLFPENGHYYQFFVGTTTWSNAEATAESMGGYLATITSASENSFVLGIASGSVAWLGGYQAPGSAEPGDGWQWITGEPFTNANWNSGEPNDSNGYTNENAIEIIGSGKWNDSSSFGARAYVVEYNADPRIRIGLIKAVKPSFSALSLGTNYQLQLSGDSSNFTNYGAAFTATNSSMIYPQYFDVENYGKLFFRLQVTP